MYLLDQIAQAKDRKVIRDPVLGDLPVLSACDLRGAVETAENRFVLQDDLIDFVYDLVFSDAALLASSLGILRLPAQTLWLEWCQPEKDGRCRTKLGAIVTAHEDGRSGECQLVFEVDGAEPEVCAITIEFDLDRPLECKGETGLFAMAHECPEIDDLLRHFRARLQPGYKHHFLRIHSRAGLKSAMQGPLNACWLAGPFVAAFCLLLMAGMPLDLKQQSRAALNVKRTAKGRAKLLDHVVVSSNVFPRHAASQALLGTGGSRRSTRLHYVRGHLVRRGDAIFWRRPHLRGHSVGGQPYNPVRRISL